MVLLAVSFVFEVLARSGPTELDCSCNMMYTLFTLQTKESSCLMLLFLLVFRKT